VRARRRRALLLLALTCVVGGEAGAQHRQLASRALFAALDSAAIEDSSALRPMDGHERLDSTMLEMAGFLDREVGPRYGVSATQVRHWDGYGTQAHPALGILVDSIEIAGLLREVTSHKGAAGVPAEEITRRLEYVVRFLIAHEYAHLLQYRSLGPDLVASPDATRIIECGADLLGGVALFEYLTSRFGGAVPHAATQTAVDFGYVVGGSDWLDGTMHPLAEDRRQCIRRGIEVGAGIRATRLLRAGAADSSTIASAGWLAENERELSQGTESLLSWSQRRSREIVSARSVVDSSAVLAVVRDSSVERLVGRLAAAAMKGAGALRAFRGERAPASQPPYLLREALPPPWECVIGEVDGAETARCSSTTRGNGAALVFAEVVREVQSALLGSKWRQAATKSGQATGGGDERGERIVTRGERTILKNVTFAPKGSSSGDHRAARIEVVLDQDASSFTAQLEPESMMTLTVRARR
jgi:hypothetical protein